MIVGSLYEDRNFEQRVAVTPEVIKKYKNLGLNIVLPKGYSEHLGIHDEEFKKEGVEFLENNDDVIRKSNIILQLNSPNDEILNKLTQTSKLSWI